MKTKVKKPHVSQNTGNNEWYTPSRFITAAREVLGEIDLDPASSGVANAIVQSLVYYTEKENGLAHEWNGRVWMNPPYSQPKCSMFCEKISRCYEEGKVKEAIVLVNNATETRWFQMLLGLASAVCFPSGRIKFLDQEGNPSGSPLQGQAFIYLGKNTSKFYSSFRMFGRVAFFNHENKS